MNFSLAAIALLVALFLYAWYRAGSLANVRAELGAGEMKGIFLATLFFLVIGLAFHVAESKADEYSYLKYTEVFAGIDRTKNISPQCKSGLDEHLTSNLGLRQNLVYTDTFQVNAKYTHHSCAIAPDRNPYDAIGIEITKKFWWK